MKASEIIFIIENGIGVIFILVAIFGYVALAIIRRKRKKEAMEGMSSDLREYNEAKHQRMQKDIGDDVYEGEEVHNYSHSDYED